MLPGGDELVSAMREVGKIARDLMSALPPAAAGASRELAAFDRLQGYPVLVRHFSGETPTREDVLQSIDRQRNLQTSNSFIASTAHQRLLLPMRNDPILFQIACSTSDT